jgi:hypothetical protein
VRSIWRSVLLGLTRRGMVAKPSHVTDDLSVEAALQRLGAWMSRDGHEIQESMRPPAIDRELDELRRAIEPCEVPSEVVTMLLVSDGCRDRSRRARSRGRSRLRQPPSDHRQQLACGVVARHGRHGRGRASSRPPYSECQRLIAARAEQAGWSHWPHERIIPHDLEASNRPKRWRAASGF